MAPTPRSTIEADLRRLRVAAGELLFFHSSLSSMGAVEGGADTVVDALLAAVAAGASAAGAGSGEGAGGTLAAPAFTFRHGRRWQRRLYDPVDDRSEMGVLSETLRQRPAALRSHHLLHSIVAQGREAAPLTARHGPAAWGADGPFWQLYVRDARLLLLGVPYQVCTFFHVVEQYACVPYRMFHEVAAQIRKPDGSLAALPTRVFGRRRGVRNDFNKLGVLLERRGLVTMAAVGNAMCRLFRVRDAFDVGVEELRRDPQLFLLTGERHTELTDGVTVERPGHWLSVVDSGKIYRRLR